MDYSKMSDDDIDRQRVIIRECDSCQGLGTIDETKFIGKFGNPEAECPDCGGVGEWYERQPGEE